MDDDPGASTYRQNRASTPLVEGSALGEGSFAPTSTDQTVLGPPPVAPPPRSQGNPAHDRSGPKRAPDLPPEPKSGGNKALPIDSNDRSRNTGSRPPFVPPEPKSGPNRIVAPISDKRPAVQPLQPLPTLLKDGKNPWGSESSGGSGSNTDKRLSDTPKTVIGTSSEANKDPLIGIQLGEYRVTHQLGSGGMGIVYRGEQPLIGKQVAIKVLRPELASDPRQVQRLVDEARAVNAVNHPGLINIFSFGETPDGAKYFVMDLLEGQSLEELLHARGRIKAWEAVPILEGALSALDAAHGAGVIHRDLKPSNIFLVDLPDGTHLVKLLDFGLAKIGGPRGSTPQTMNVVVGTPEYMAPEQARAHEVSPRTDIYAMGIVAYELLTGNVPFTCESAVETLMMQLDVVPKPAGELEPSIPAALEKLLMRMLEKRPEDRPTTAGEVKRELGRIKRQLTNAETQIAPAVQLPSSKGAGTEPIPSSQLEKLLPTPPPSRPPAPPIEPRPPPPGAKRFETTDVMPPVVTELEARSATDRMKGRSSPGAWLIPTALAAAITLLAGVVYFGYLRDPALQDTVVPPPPPPPVKKVEQQPPPPPKKVEKADPPPVEPVKTEKADPPPPVKTEKAEKADPTPPPKKETPVRTPRKVEPKLKHTEDEVMKRLETIAKSNALSESTQQKRITEIGLTSLRRKIANRELTPDQAWSALDGYDKPPK